MSVLFPGILSILSSLSQLLSASQRFVIWYILDHCLVFYNPFWSTAHSFLETHLSSCNKAHVCIWDPTLKPCQILLLGAKIHQFSWQTFAKLKVGKVCRKQTHFELFSTVKKLCYKSWQKIWSVHLQKKSTYGSHKRPFASQTELLECSCFFV